MEVNVINILLATNNIHKKEEFNRMLNPLGYTVLSLKDKNIDIDIEENGISFDENATIKAKTIYGIVNIPVIADDSGLEVDYLNKKPGIYSARYGGEDLSDLDRCKLILSQLEGVSLEKRTARFCCSICYIDMLGKVYIVNASCEGKIGFEIKGENGFGYDNIFLYGNKTFAEIDGHLKDKVSHRAKAIDKFLNLLKNINC